jgi:hypothetical protein
VTHVRAWAHCSILIAALSFAAGCGSGSSSTPPPTITSVTVSCAAPSVTELQTDQCSANVQGTGSFSTAVTWNASAGNISASGLFTAPSAAGPLTVTATSVADGTKSGSATLMVPPAQKSGFTYRGITHVSWQANEYNTGSGTTSQDALAATGASWAGVLVTWYQASATATTIAAASNTPSDAAVIAAITELHNKNVKVMLKPHVDATDGSWRGTFQPTDVNAWFASFTTFITHYAQLAHDNNAEMLCFGTEFVQLSKDNLANWTNVIGAIRAIYTGPLAYAANATDATDEFTSVVFWNQVDVLGLDAYFPLTNQNDPTVAQLVAAWSLNRDGNNWVAAVQNFAGAHPVQPVIFTEIGYRSVAGTNKAPWDFSFSGTVDEREQQSCYEAMYEVWSGNPAVMQGNFWWDWSVPPPVVTTDTDYTPWNKSAQTVLQNWQ